MIRCIVHPNSYTGTKCPEVPWKNLLEQPFCYTSEKDLADWKALVNGWMGPCDACGKNACLVDEIICPTCKGKGSK